jgi:multicomponent Na+:H+ antiporter subunit B
VKEQLILRVTTKFIIPFIIMFALYVQTHGEYSPGGGFQAGVILAAAFILYSLIFGLNNAMNIISIATLKVFACFGVLIYSGVGVITMVKGANFLSYNVLGSTAISGQQWGIFTIELGVGLTVFSVMLLLFFVFADRIKK